MMYVVTDSLGAILKSGTCAAEETAVLQAGVGQTVYVSTDTDQTYVDDANIMVSDATLEAVSGYMGNVPELTLNAL